MIAPAPASPPATLARALALALALAPIATACRRGSGTPPPAPADASPRPGPQPARTYHLVDAGLPRPPAARAGIRVDLYVPPLPAAGARPPLLVFALGGLWSMPDANYMVGASAGDALQRLGVATAVVRVARDDGYQLPRCTEDVARVVAFLVGKAADYGFDPQRVVLGGHDPGAVLALRLGLDAALLARAGVDARRIAGIVSLRGIFDLGADALKGHPRESFLAWAVGRDEAARKSASPVTYVRGDGPPVLLFAAAKDLPGYAQRARRFARALEAAGARHVQSHIVPETTAETLLTLAGEGNPVGALIADFARGAPVPAPIDGPWGVRQLWSMSPPLSTEPFWADHAPLVRKHAVDGRFRAMLARIFQEQMFELNPWPGEQYHAIDLDEYLRARRPEEIGRGAHLVVTNLRGERLFLARADIERHRPRIVIGLDDERNLYRVFAAYRMNRLYSWVKETGPPPKMIRPVGAFLHFPGDVPKRLWNGTFAFFGLGPSSFRLQQEDPLGPIRALPREIQEVLTGPSGCLYCHAFRGAGARSHHVTAAKAEPWGAFALALEEYPPQVLRDFLFDQDRVAGLFGVKPLRVPRPRAERLLAAVLEERRGGPREPVLGPLPAPPRGR